MPTTPPPGAPRPGAPRRSGATQRPARRAPGLLERARNILLQPASEWQRIRDEFATVGAIYGRYVVPLAGFAALCQVVGHLLWGKSVPFLGKIIVSPSQAVRGGLAFFVGQLVAVYVLALIIDALAPTFGGRRNQVQAVKVAAYAGTASWVAGVFVLVPGGQWLTLLGFYSLILLYLGVGPVMSAPRDRALGYATLSITSAIVLYLVVTAVAAAFLPGR